MREIILWLRKRQKQKKKRENGWGPCPCFPAVRTGRFVNTTKSIKTEWNPRKSSHPSESPLAHKLLLPMFPAHLSPRFVWLNGRAAWGSKNNPRRPSTGSSRPPKSQNTHTHMQHARSIQIAYCVRVHIYLMYAGISFKENRSTNPSRIKWNLRRTQSAFSRKTGQR